MNGNQQFAVSVHILTALASNAEKPLTSAQIAVSVGTNPVVIRRILGHLRKKGLVDAQRGAVGGWRLSRAPQQIALCEVYRAISHENVLAMHHNPSQKCPIGSEIQGTLGRVFTDAQAALETALGKFTVADILSDIWSRKSPDV